MLGRGDDAKAGSSNGGMALVALAAALAARPAVGDEIELRMDAGRVTLIATEARLTEVLAAWSRIGQTRFVDAEAVAGESVTLHLVDVGEAEALRILLRPATGYATIVAGVTPIKAVHLTELRAAVAGLEQ